MRHFLKKFLFFSFTLFVLLIPLDYYCSQFLKESDTLGFGESRVWNDIYSGNINAEMVIYGSSRARKHINPIQIEEDLGYNTYNLGIDGFGFDLQYLRHKEYLENNKNPEYIILSIDIFTFTERKELFNLQQFLPYMLFNKDFFHYTSSKKGFSFLDYCIPLIRYSGQSNALLEALKIAIKKDTVKSQRTNGFNGLDNKWSEDLKTAKTNMKSYEIKVNEKLEQLFHTFLNECLNKNIEVILVYSPVFKDGQMFVLNRDEIMNKYKSLAKSYNLTYLNYSDHPICLQKEYFYNSQHLNSKGAELFTSILAHDLYDHSTLELEKELK